MTTFKPGQRVRWNGENWVVVGVGTTFPDSGTYLHLKHSTAGALTKAGFCPRGCCIWSDKDGPVEMLT